MTTRAVPNLSFSTLACPEWTPELIVERCADMGYDGIEWRGGRDGHVSTSWPATRRAELRELMAYGGVAALAVTSYATFTSPSASTRAENVDDLAAHVRLAADLRAPFVRSFIGWREDANADLIDRVATSLLQLTDLAVSLGVTIALEQHDDFVTAQTVKPILERLPPSSFGAVWDIGNAWAEGETPETTFAELGPWMRYMQIKDGIGRAETWQLTSHGAGEVPIARALALPEAVLPISVEWEKAWHDELSAADVELPHAAAFIRAALLTVRTSGGG